MGVTGDVQQVGITLRLLNGKRVPAKSEGALGMGRGAAAMAKVRTTALNDQ